MADATDPVGGRTHPVAAVVAIGTTLLAVAAVLLWTVDGALVAAQRPHWLVLALVVVGFGLAERFTFHVEYRREAISFSVSEVPAALALAFVSPVLGVLLRVLVSLTVIGTTTRPRAYKLYFNAGLFSFEMALAYTIVRAFGSPGPDLGSRFLLATAAALAVATLLGSIVVSVAISQFEGRLLARLADELRISILTTPVITMLASVTVAPTLFLPELVLFPLVPIAAAWLVMLQFGKLSQHHRDLEALHGFSGVVGRAVHVGDVADIAVREAARLLRANHGVLLVFDEDGRPAATAGHGQPIAGVPTEASDPAWRSVVDAAGAVACSVRPDGTVVVGDTTRRSLLAAAIRDDEGLIGLLVVAERSGAVATFDTAEVSRANTLAEQLGSTLRRALLHSRMEHVALHDDLTDEPNRLFFERAVALAEPTSRRGCTAVMMLDLDRFKEVNDTLGHHVGDRVLCEFTARVKQHLRDDDILARFGGDEFAVLVRRPDLAAVRELADQILAASFTPMRLDELDVVVTASIGIAEVGADDADTSDVLRQADVAMYTAKREHTRIECYRREIDRRTPERLALLGGLRDVLDREALEVHYQPKVDLVTSTVVGAEALVRWNHPSRGWIPPIDFVQVAEESGLIKQLTDQVLRAALQTASGWSAAGYDLGVAVNLSTHDLLDERLDQRIGEMLSTHGLAPEKLTLEITESALLADTPRTMGTIERLDRLGVRLSLDDFGTGYSSLGYLRRLPVAELKIDRGFVENVVLDEQDETIVRSTIELGHNLGLQVVAEGIENTPVLDRLRSFGCDIGQGYGIARPLDPKMFAAWLSTTEYALPRRDTRSLA